MFRKLKELALKLLKDGLSPGKIALGIAVGIAIGNFPLYGPSTIMCLLAIALFRLNTPLVLAGHYSMTFVKPFLILPFLRIGEFVFRAEPLPLDLVALTRQFKADAWGTLQEFGWSFLHAVVGWCVMLPLMVGGIYLVVKPMVVKWQALRVKD
ncbi:MAG: hypothetical protein ACI9TH_000298 [Kiritimatiellia bacterium]|jgi:uncharacterized protein (DUF2062 family)